MTVAFWSKVTGCILCIESCLIYMQCRGQPNIVVALFGLGRCVRHRGRALILGVLILTKRNRKKMYQINLNTQTLQQMATLHSNTTLILRRSIIRLQIWQLSTYQPSPHIIFPPVIHAFNALPKRLLVHSIYFIFPSIKRSALTFCDFDCRFVVPSKVEFVILNNRIHLADLLTSTTLKVHSYLERRDEVPKFREYLETHGTKRDHLQVSVRPIS
jgi:hypothetical protein